MTVLGPLMALYTIAAGYYVGTAKLSPCRHAPGVRGPGWKCHCHEEGVPARWVASSGSRVVHTQLDTPSVGLRP
eukprot:3098714-Rhodomonas_salina.5